MINGVGGYNEKYSFLGLSGGTAGQALIKNSSAAGGYTWQNIPNDIPSGGSIGQVLTNDGNNTFSWQSVTSFTYSNVGVGNAVYKDTSGNNVNFRGVKKSDSSTFPFQVQLSSSGDDIEIDIDKVNPDDALELNEADITWGAIGSPTSNGFTSDFNGYIQNLVSSSAGTTTSTILDGFLNNSPIYGGLSISSQCVGVKYGEMVSLEGTISSFYSSNGATGDELILTLPVGLRPKRKVSYYGNVQVAATGTPRILEVNTNGDIVLSYSSFLDEGANIPTRADISLSGITFEID